jgi:glycosyltransferase involved in cell wall biosynthesis
VNGLLCEPKSEALRAAIETMQRDPELAQRLGTAARAEIETKFSLDRIVDKELSLLKGLVA